MSPATQGRRPTPRGALASPHAQSSGLSRLILFPFAPALRSPRASLRVQKKMTVRSDRVKSVDMHPTEPWVCCALYSGKVVIYNYSTSLPFKVRPPASVL